MRVHTLNGKFKEGDEVIDRTAETNGWPDKEGVVEEADGSQLKIRYISGQMRWKMHINVRLKDVGAEKERLAALREENSN